MKTLILVRHAKSDKNIPGLTDFERPLNAKGEHDAKKMAEGLAKRKIAVDLILSSPSVRTFATAKYFAETLHYPINKVLTDESIYFGNTLKLLRIIQNLNDNFDSVMLVGHNPDITSFASRLTGEYFVDVPTSGIVCIDFSLEKWGDVDDGIGRLRFFTYPGYND